MGGGLGHQLQGPSSQKMLMMKNSKFRYVSLRDQDIPFCQTFHGAKIPTANDDTGGNVLEEEEEEEEEEEGVEVTEVKDLDQEAQREEGRPGGPEVR